MSKTTQEYLVEAEIAESRLSGRAKADPTEWNVHMAKLAALVVEILHEQLIKENSD